VNVICMLIVVHSTLPLDMVCVMGVEIIPEGTSVENVWINFIETSPGI
jgi:hypothetical protein